MKTKVDTFFEDFNFNMDTHKYDPTLSSSMHDQSDNFYDKYTHILDKLLKKDGSEQTVFRGLHPDVQVMLAALKNEDKYIPPTFKASFTGHTNIGKLRSLFTAMMKANMDPSAYDEDLISHYIRYAKEGTKVYNYIESLNRAHEDLGTSSTRLGKRGNIITTHNDKTRKYNLYQQLRKHE